MNESDNGAYYDSCMEVNIFPSVLLFNSHICVQKRKLANGKKVLCYNKTNKNQQTEHGVAVNEYEFIIRQHSIFFHVIRVYNPISSAIMFVCVCAYAFCVLLQCVMRVFCLSGNQQGSVWLGEHLAPEATGSHNVSGWLMPMAEIRRRQ